jgi:aldehyde dehydrogenase (NAD+)
LSTNTLIESASLSCPPVPLLLFLCFEIPPHIYTSTIMTSIQLETPSTGKYEQPTGLFINNEFVKGVDGKTFEVINPSNEKVICSVHEASEKDVDIAVAAARKAFEGDWRKVTPCDRGKLLVKLADLFDQHSDQLAAIESLDNGKAFTMAKGDVAAASGCLRYYGGWADKIEGKVVDTSPDTFNYIRKEPVSRTMNFITRQTLTISRSVFVVRSSPGTSPS